MKTCEFCGEKFETANYHPQQKYCNSECQRKKYYEDHRKEIEERRRNRDVKKKYNLTSEDYNKMYDKQYGRCAICDTHQSELKYTLSIDHNHKNGKVRGLLCNNCNGGLGMFKDNKLILDKAIKYLMKND